MKLEKAVKRDRKQNKRKHGMRVVGASVKLLERIKEKKSKEQG